MRIRYAVVVIYNREAEDSPSVRSLLKQDVSLIVVDNSTDETIRMHNLEQIQAWKQTYLSMNGNAGLSKAYNKAVEYILRQDDLKEDYVLIMDDDTNVPDDYIEKAQEQMKNQKADIYLPIVKDQLGILSPSKISTSGYAHRVNSLDEINEKNICGINSGMVISINVFKSVRYDERMFLDFVDHAFIREVKKKKYTISILSLVLEQAFSAVTDNKEAARRRLGILKKDLKVFYEGSFKEKMVYHYVIFRRTLRHILKYRDFSILKS